MSGYPKRGRGIVLEHNREDSSPGVIKYNIRVTSELHTILTKAETKDQIPAGEEHLGWTLDPETGWYVIGYEVHDDQVTAAAADSHCDVGGP